MSGDSAERADSTESTETAADATGSATASASSGLPLDGVRVLELGHIIAGPFCSMLLADLGADVIKVEHPEGGDLIRGSSPVGNSSFNYVNRDKRSLTLDLKSDAALDAFFDLLDETDVVVENYAPGTAERLGIGYEQLRETHPGLVYCSIKGFNPGPYESYPALDPIAEALSGLMSVTGHEGMPPVRSGTSIADMAASFYGAIAVLGALYRRDRTGEGSKVTAPLFESTVSMMGYWLAYTEAYDDVPGPMGASHPNWAPYDVFETADDEWVFIGPSGERQWTALCEALGLDLHEDERFATLPDRRENLDELMDLLRAECETLPAADLVAGLREVGVPVAKVNSMDEVATDPHLRATDFFTEVETAEGASRSVSVPRFPVVASGFDRPDSTDPPKLGEHTEAILSSLGYDDADIDALRRAGGV
ncbi:CAIB/BAIF family protein [Haloferax volcanii DSM 14919]|uniref:CAIB/BAIF family protein n=1 Tax=Haloferax lucentense (strain DSM 14919 / JCM 9276 / NCIMB 13854 / Aa 2.2) TaxID=1230452 RepID=M0GK20_HALL2|nr:CaiB/BaiF CoA-transferase family protein [Haloferax lucentense]ELZ72576.1 CAIB/BAIF family protein [Haloferax lucentense DSM 14919]